MLKRATDD